MTAIKPLTVSQLNRNVRLCLEQTLAEVTVLGELSNLSKPSSGHWYFTLKDSGAQLRCVFFRTHHQNTDIFEHGQLVLASGKLSVYELRGDYQLIVNTLVKSGIGELYQQFERLKSKLAQQGLFNPERKKPIPCFAESIAIVTSQHGAALHDMLATLVRRFPLASVVIYHSDVQGKTAAQQLIAALHCADCGQHEVILLARGGGSIDDLWAFNDERLAYVISQLTTPIIAGIGHETDFTIADFVADLRAATPTAAAQAATPDQHELFNRLTQINLRLNRVVYSPVQRYTLMLDHYLASLAKPVQLISQLSQTVDFFELRLEQSVKKFLRQHFFIVQTLAQSVQLYQPAHWYTKSQIMLKHLMQRLEQQQQLYLATHRQQLSHQLTTLHTVSPNATLKRGYAIASYNNMILSDTLSVGLQDNIKVKLAQGTLYCLVTAKDNVDD